MKLSIAICSHNRAHDVIECVEALQKQVTDQPVEILVIDNASNDENAALLRSHIPARVRLVAEPRPGLSIARNRAITEAQGTWIAYLDDDAVPRHDWLNNAISAIDDASFTTGFIGGLALPRWPSTPHPQGLPPESLGLAWRDMLSIVESERSSPNSQAPMIVGCNMLIRRGPLEQIGGFDGKLGRTPTNLLGGEEIAVVHALYSLKWNTVLDPTIVVEHKIHPVRMTRAWMKQRALAEGRLMHIQAKSAALTLKCLASIPILAISGLLQVRGVRSTDSWVRLWRNMGYLQG